MRMVIKTGMKKAAGLTAAGKNELLIKSYQETPKMSNLKESIGELLLYLQTPIVRVEKHKGYSLFEILLMLYIELRYLGDKK